MFDAHTLRKFGMPASKGSEELSEMELLPAVCNVNDLVRRPVFQAILDRREISGGVVKTTVRFADQKRVRLPLPIFVSKKRILPGRKGAIRENCKRTLALPGDAYVQERLGH